MFEKGFAIGDILLPIQNDPTSYIIVQNSLKEYVVTTNGERRQRIIKESGKMVWKPALNKPALTGELSLENIS
jgi:hypothetical protein